MANITPVKNKDGEVVSYRIRVYRGRDASGKNLKPYTMNWKVPASYKTERSIQKALEKVVGEFEASCGRGEVAIGSSTFEQYANYYIESIAQDHKPSTVTFYKSLLPLLHEEIGSVKLKQLSPEHLNRLYLKLQTSDVKRDARAVGNDKLLLVRRTSKVLQKEISAETGLTDSTLHRAFHREKIKIESAEKIATYSGYKVNDLFAVSISSKGLSAKYIRHIHHFIHAVLQKALREGKVSRNVADQVIPPKMPKHEAEFFELDEILKIKQALDIEPFKYRIATYLLIDTGVRRGELVGIRWRSIDFENGTIRIENNITYTAEHGIQANTPKSGDFRTVAISSELLPILKEYQKYQKQQCRIKFSCMEDDIERARMVRAYNPDGYLFIKEDGSVMSPNALNQWMIRFSKKIGLHVHPHKFRHSQASILYANHIDIVTISKRLGHKQISTTQNIYAHLLEKSDREAANTMSELVFKQA